MASVEVLATLDLPAALLEAHAWLKLETPTILNVYLVVVAVAANPPQPNLLRPLLQLPRPLPQRQLPQKPLPQNATVTKATTTKATTTKSTTAKSSSSLSSSSHTSSSSASPSLVPVSGAYLLSGSSGTGTTTRYWDCCKPSCAWTGKGSVTAPVDSCAANGVAVLSPSVTSGCDGGTAYMCNNQQPWVINDNLAYGFAAATIAGLTEQDWCCTCYALTFTSTAVAGKTFVVQITNTGGDLGANQFDLQLPGGGVGIFNGCSTQWGAPSTGWGAQYGGISSLSDCSSLPSQLQAGCEFRFGWFENADNPSVSFEQVKCPTQLTSITGCARTD
ncbi:hypothetical protein NQZ79_g5641 [Umbelopsis isabellina]|nr:hypothetical protein NQZ79_g5641 [Umbelopsis isabellina]